MTVLSVVTCGGVDTWFDGIFVRLCQVLRMYLPLWVFERKRSRVSLCCVGICAYFREFVYIRCVCVRFGVLVYI